MTFRVNIEYKEDLDVVAMERWLRQHVGPGSVRHHRAAQFLGTDDWFYYFAADPEHEDDDEALGQFQWTVVFRRDVDATAFALKWL